MIRPATPASRTVSALSACVPPCWWAWAPKVTAETSSTIRAMQTDSMSMRPSLASGRSSHPSHLISRSSKTKSRKIIRRNMPPKAAIDGCASVTSSW
ncbi:hypothetical protein ADL35_22165 [Streptomyces sp. NRRL WC-3753]|nr:hypothetical protein ADL35_22165 [Streptomyces sp. NRRL WC-3753]